MKPITQYAKSGSINIAYQVFGSGPIDLVYIPGWVSNIDWMWNCPELVHFFQELGKITRVVLFDKRGTGLSDRISELSTLEERMDDIRAVMDAVNIKKAVLFGHSEGGSVSALFAATYPGRTISLITFGIFAKRRYSENYPWAPTDAERQVVYDMIENSWGSGKMNLESLAPSKANDRVFMDWLANYFRSGASPSAALVLTKMNTNVDIIDILGSINVPALILQRTHDIDVKIEEGRFIADRIPNAKFVELEGNDHLFWVGDTTRVLNEIKAFVTDTKPEVVYEKRIYTIGAVRIISDKIPSVEELEFLIQYVARYSGKLIQSDSKTFMAHFDGPSKAVNCAFGLADAASRLNAQLQTVVHIKEGAIDESNAISKETRFYIERIFEITEPNQILVTQTVKYLLSGSGFTFHKIYKPFPKTISEEPQTFFVVSDDARETTHNEFYFDQLPIHNSFFENVLQCIYANLEDDAFGVEKLSRDIGVSERQLQRKLKAITNKSPIQLIASVRLHRAKKLLLEESHNVSEIAYRTGYSNPSYFSKSFKREFGVSPSYFLQKQV